MQFHRWLTMLMSVKRPRDAGLVAKEYSEESARQWAQATQALRIKYFLLLQLCLGRQPAAVLEDSVNPSLWTSATGRGKWEKEADTCQFVTALSLVKASIIHGAGRSCLLNCSWKGKCFSELNDNHVKGEVSWQNSLNVCRAVEWYLLQLAEDAKERGTVSNKQFGGDKAPRQENNIPQWLLVNKQLEGVDCQVPPPSLCPNPHSSFPLSFLELCFSGI